MMLASDPVCEYPDSDVFWSDEPTPERRYTPRPNARLLDRWFGHARIGKEAKSLSMVSRMIDIIGASLLLLIALPFLLVLAVALKIDSPGKLFFVQRRVGLNGREFSCIKFRTMVDNADAALQAHLANSPAARLEWALAHKLRNDPRITTLGVLVRKLSLDEFPQLLNIIRGDMSLVGPRPIVQAEVERYGRYFEEYCAVRPGLTGLWQVSGRNDISYRRRVSIDCYYVRNKSLALDLAILFRTAPAVLSRRGSY